MAVTKSLVIRILLYFTGPTVAFLLNWGNVSLGIALTLAIIASILHVYYRNIYIPLPIFLIRLAAFTAVQLILAAMFRHHGAPWYIPGGEQRSAPYVEESEAVPMVGKQAVNFLESHPVITMSVVLPCANEGRFAWKTAEAIADNTPEEILHEIVIVDDGSSPPLISQFPKDIIEKAKVKFVRHESHTGLINAKSAGANVASGDVIVFLDCHVKPDAGWARPIVEKIRSNYKRVVVPSITGLNADTWEEIRGGGGQSKCYLTWDADFKWFDSDDEHIAVMSGGLLAMSRQWWIETGGYDTSMQGWGGENLDQSLRIWLCGGEIVNAKESYVGHMWRTHDKPDTLARYTVPPGSVVVNRYKGTSVWMGEWAEKLETFPVFKPFKLKKPDVSSIQAVKDRLKCKHFSFFIDKFYKVYHWGGLLPQSVFHLRDTMSGLCLQRSGGEELKLAPCSDESSGQRWHRSNRDGEKCCSGYRNWNSDQCVLGSWVGGQARTSVCNVGGYIQDQYVKLNPATHQLEFTNRPGACLGGKITEKPKAEFHRCEDKDFSQKFKKIVSDHALAQPGVRDDLFRLEDTSRPGTCLAAMGTRIEIHDCDPKAAVQIFSVRKIGSENRLVAHGLTGSSKDGSMCIDAGLDGNEIGLYGCYMSGQNSNQHVTMDTIGGDSLMLKYHNGDKCVSIPAQLEDAHRKLSETPLVLAECIVNSGIVKRGQYFEKVFPNDSDKKIFALRNKDGLCLTVNKKNEFVLTKEGCDVHLFKFDPEDPHSRLMHVPTSLCFDGNNGKTPTLYSCYDGDNSNQQVEFVGDGHSIRLDRTHTCLDFEPAEASPANVIPCSVAETAFHWEEHNPFVPIETELYNKHKNLKERSEE